MLNTVEYYLTKLAEECAEVVKAATKSICFGLDPTVDEGNKYNNQQKLEQEICDLLATIDKLEEIGVINLTGLEIPYGLIVEKKRKMDKYLKASRELGIVEFGGR